MGEQLKTLKSPFAFVVAGVIGFFLFQNCSSNTNFNQATSTTTEAILAPTTNPSDVVSGNSLELKVTHISGNRAFLVNIKNINITDSQCRLQYFKDNTTWTDLNQDFHCNTDTGSQTFYLPTQDNWANNFNSAGIRIRIVKATSNKQVIAEFNEKLKCTPQMAGSNPTPNLDENCNGKWDDVDNGTKQFYYAPSAAKAFNSEYGCPTENVRTAGDNKLATFVEMEWRYGAGISSNSNCDYDRTMINVTGPSQTRTSPDATGRTPEHVYMTDANRCVESQGARVVDGQVLTVDGFSRHSAEWSTANCVYSYYPDAKYY